MEIKGFIDLSLTDWDGKVSSIIFLPGGNMRCPFCYNTTLVLHPETMLTIPFEEIENYLRRNMHACMHQTTNPRFRNMKKSLEKYKKGLFILRSFQCSYTEKM